MKMIAINQYEDHVMLMTLRSLGQGQASDSHINLVISIYCRDLNKNFDEYSYSPSTN